MFSRAHPRPKCSSEAYVGPPRALRGHPEWTLPTTRREGATGALAFGSLEGGFTLMSGQGPLQWSACGGVTPADRGPPGKKGEGPWTSSPEAPRGQCPRGQQSTDAGRMLTGQRYSENSIHSDRSSLFHGRIGPSGEGRPAARGHAPSKWQSQDPGLGRAIDDLSPGRPFHAQRCRTTTLMRLKVTSTHQTHSLLIRQRRASLGRTDAQEGDQGTEPQSRNGGSVPRKTEPLSPPGLGDTSTARGPA